MLPFFVIVFTCLFVQDPQDVGAQRATPQDAPESDRVIDNIFNIPITALRQTSVVAQSANPEKTRSIDDIFKIPISTLEAVSDLVKSTNGQRRFTPEEIQQMRQERREKVLAERERQRVHREKIVAERLQQKNLKKLIKRYHKDPFGVNALTDLLVGHHGVLSGHGQHGLNGLLGSHSGHNFGNAGQGIFSGSHSSSSSGGHGNRPNRPHHPSHHTYEVHEEVDEEDDGSSVWQGVSAAVAGFTRPVKIQNKIAPKGSSPTKSKYSYDDVRIQNKVAPIEGRTGRVIFEDDAPVNKIAPKSSRIVFP